MINRKLTTLGFGLAVAVSAVACDNNNITDVNHNPNSPESAPAPALFTQATVSAVGRFLGSGYDLRGTEFLSQHLAEVQYPDEDQYTRLGAATTSGYFDAPYYTELEDFQKAYDKGVASNNNSWWAPALTMQVWTFSYITDTWGDVPYSQALKGDSGYLQPVYDKQSDIYKSFFARLDSVANALQTPNPLNYGSADLIYGGDPAAWQKFANSMHLRLAMRVVNVDPALARSEFEKALNNPGGVFTSNADDAALSWPGDGVFNNPWSVNFQTRDDHRLSNRLTTIMGADNDPRLQVYGQPAQADTNPNGTACPPGGCYNGAPNAITASPFLKIASRPGVFTMPAANSYAGASGPGAKAPSYLMTYSEVEFLLAEAAARGWTVPGTAAAHYYKGIEASMEQWGVTDAAAITAYEAQGPNPNPGRSDTLGLKGNYGDSLGVVYQGGVTGQKQIAQQKWISFFTQGGQAWFEWRRTCQPNKLVAGAGAQSVATYKGIPRRLEYSVTEIASNGTNVAAANNGAADNFVTPVWWDVMANAPTCQ